MRKIVWAIVALLLLGGGYVGYQRMSAAPAIEVLETGRVVLGDIRAVLVETGIVKPQVGAQVKIGARATGEIMEMRVKVGDRVRKGELIALIDDREILRQIQQTRAALRSAQQTYLQNQKTFPERIREARANYEFAAADYAREKQLIENEYTTQKDVDRARSEYEARKAIWDRLVDEYATQLEIDRANIAALKAQLKQQEIRLSYTRIYAPIDGVVAEVTAQEGETIVSGLQVSNLVTILDPRRLEMWIYVDETDIGRLQEGQKVEYYVDTYPDKSFHGTVGSIYPQPVVRDNITYYLAIVAVPVEDAPFLRPEMTTYVKIVMREKTDVLVAPNAAVKFEAGRQIGYRVTGPNAVEKIDLKIGIRGEEKTEILDGAQRGDELATRLILPVSVGNPAGQGAR